MPCIATGKHYAGVFCAVHFLCSGLQCSRIQFESGYFCDVASLSLQHGKMRPLVARMDRQSSICSPTSAVLEEPKKLLQSAVE